LDGEAARTVVILAVECRGVAAGLVLAAQKAAVERLTLDDIIAIAADTAPREP
jgi:hypothetical protein